MKEKKKEKKKKEEEREERRKKKEKARSCPLASSKVMSLMHSNIIA